MKKILALLLALVMILALAACGENKDNGNGQTTTAKTDPTTTVSTTVTTAPPAEKSIVGAWKYEISLSGEALGYIGLTATIDLEITETFNADGTFTFAVNEEKLLASMPAFEAFLIEYMIENYYEGDESLREIITDTVAGMDMGAMMIESYNSVAGTYTVAGDKLTTVAQFEGEDLDAEVYTFAFVGNTIELYAANDLTEVSFEVYGIDKLVLIPA